MSPILQFTNFRLQIEIICLDCNTSELVLFRLGDDLEGNYIASEVEELFFFVKDYAQAVKIKFQLILKKNKSEVIRSIYNGLNSD